MTARSSGLTPRNFYVLSYAQYLHADSALWRITVAYMYSCGKIGAKTADEVLVRVPLRLHGVGPTERNAGERSSKGDLSGIIKDLNATCHEYERENVRRSICRVESHRLRFQPVVYRPLMQIAARTFVQKKEYGLALSYCSSAEDWPGLGRVVDRILQEYIYTGSAHGVLSCSCLTCFRSRTIHQIRPRYRSVPPGPPRECWSSWRFHPSIDICCAICRVSSAAVESGPTRCRLGPGDNISRGDCAQVLVGGFAMRRCSASAIWQVLTQCAAHAARN